METVTSDDKSELFKLVTNIETEVTTAAGGLSRDQEDEKVTEKHKAKKLQKTTDKKRSKSKKGTYAYSSSDSEIDSDSDLDLKFKDDSGPNIMTQLNEINFSQVDISDDGKVDMDLVNSILKGLN